MTISEIVKKMIDYSEGNLHDIQHFLKVYAYAKTIGELEGLDSDKQFILEVAAVTHDIACPLCREKYGSTDGRLQEEEGPPLVRTFLAESGMSQADIERVAYLVGHHHTYTGVEGEDYRILLQADYLVNADEMNHSKGYILHAKDKIFRTESGTALLESIYEA